MSKTPIVDQNSIDTAKRNLGRITVLAITVSKYEHLESLPGANQDLRLIKNVFLGGDRSLYKQSQFKELLNPTTQKVREEILDYVYSRSAHGDILIFYFSGHGCVIGTNNFGFCLSDTKLGAVKEGQVLPLSTLSFREVVQTLTAVDVHPVFIIDACFSGATAHTFVPTISASMQDDLHIHAAGSYGLLCSTSIDSFAIDTNNGGAFTQAIHTIVSQGLLDRVQRHWPFLTLKNIALPLQERLTQEGYPLSKRYFGPDLPEIPIAKNVKFKPRIEKFTPYLRSIIERTWNDGSPRETTRTELRNLKNAGPYGNHSKLSYKPWALLENGSRKGTRRLTEKGKRFAQGKVRIPLEIIKDPVTQEWIPAPNTKKVFINKISLQKD